MASKMRARSTERKRKRVCVEEGTSPFDDLPRDMVVEILEKVVAGSFEAFFSVKQCCKSFAAAAEDDRIYKRLSLREFPDKWGRAPEKAVELVQQCIRRGNTDALYWQGVYDFFSDIKLDEGISSLREAARAGDAGAAYILGVIYIGSSSDAASRREGVEMLKGVHKEGKVAESRERFERAIKRMWNMNRLVFRERPSFWCQSLAEHWEGGPMEREINPRVRPGVWCESCICQTEALFLYKHCPPLCD